MPDPDTPVTPTKQPNGIDNVIFFRLFPVASFKVKNLPVPILLCSGGVIDFFPERKPLFTMTKKEGIEKAVKHIFSAAYQHQLEFPMANWKEPVKEMFYKDIENIYKKSKLKVGVPPEILNMFKYKRV